MRKLLLSLLLPLVVLSVRAASYNGVYMTVSGVYNQQDSTVTITITRADVLDAESHVVEGEQMIGFEILRGEGHDTQSKIGEVAAVKFISSMPEAPVVYVDRSLPNLGTSGSILLSYSVVAVIGDYHSQANEVGSYNIDYQNYPNPVSDLVATIAEDQRSVTLSFTAPTHYTNGKPLTSINSIKIEKYNMDTYTWKAVKTFRSVNAKPGSQLSWTDTTIIREQQMAYRVQVWTVGGKVTIENGTGTGTQEVDRNMHSEYAQVNVYIGEDAPTEMQSLRAEMQEGRVTLTWVPSNKGLYGGQLDLSSLRYRVQRSIEGGAFVTLAEACTETTYIDSALLKNVASYLYVVTPYNSIGTAAGSSAEVYGGEPYSLPFVETAGGSHAFDHTGWVTSSVKGTGVGGWCASTYMMDTKNERYVYAPDNSGVITTLIYSSNTAVGRCDYLLSAPIYSEGHLSYRLSLDYYGMQGFDNVLAVELCNNKDEYTEIGRISYDTIAADGWRTAIWTVDSFPTYRTLRIRVVGIKGKNSNSFALDNLRLESLDENRDEPADDPEHKDDPKDEPNDEPNDEPEGEVVEQVYSEGLIRKTIVNGQLIILRDGQSYTVMGQRR